MTQLVNFLNLVTDKPLVADVKLGRVKERNVPYSYDSKVSKHRKPVPVLRRVLAVISCKDGMYHFAQRLANQPIAVSTDRYEEITSFASGFWEVVERVVKCPKIIAKCNKTAQSTNNSVSIERHLSDEYKLEVSHAMRYANTNFMDSDHRRSPPTHQIQPIGKLQLSGGGLINTTEFMSDLKTQAEECAGKTGFVEALLDTRACLKRTRTSSGIYSYKL